MTFECNHICFSLQVVIVAHGVVLCYDYTTGFIVPNCNSHFINKKIIDDVRWIINSYVSWNNSTRQRYVFYMFCIFFAISNQLCGNSTCSRFFMMC